MQKTASEKKKKIIWTIAIIFVLVAVVFLINFISVFTGNPFLKMRAQQKVTNYITEKYPNESFGEVKVEYDKRQCSYVVELKSENNIDVQFPVYVRRDGTIYDGYDEYVASGSRTYNRLSGTFNNKVNDVLNAGFDGNIMSCVYNIHSENSENYNISSLYEDVGLNGDLDTTELDEHNFEPVLTLVLIEDEMTAERVGQYIADIDELMTANDIYVSLYSVALISNENFQAAKYTYGITVDNFPAEYIGTDEMTDKIQEYAKLME